MSTPRPPHEEWAPRTDAGARKLIERIDEFTARVTHSMEAYGDKLEELEEHIEAQLRRMDAKVKARPTKARMIGLAAGFAVPVLGLFFGITWQISTRVADSSERVIGATLKVFQEGINDRLKASDLKHQAEHRALYDSAPRRRRSELLEKPPAEAEPEHVP